MHLAEASMEPRNGHLEDGSNLPIEGKTHYLTVHVNLQDEVGCYSYVIIWSVHNHDWLS